MERPARKLQITVISALDLPKYGSRTPKCYVLVKVAAGEIKQTRMIKSTNPVWNEALVFDAEIGSTIHMQLFHDPRQPIMFAEATATVSLAYFQPRSESVAESYELKLFISSIRRQRPRINVSYAAIQSSPTASIAPTLDTPATVTLEPWQDLTLLTSITSGAGPSPMFSNRFGTVVGYLDRFVQIGSAITEVHPYAKATWLLLTAGQKVLRDQQDRDVKIQELWATIQETLEFMEHIDPLKDIKGLEQTVQAIMKQIYECAVFLRKYQGSSFLTKVVINNLTMETDKIIQQFITTFIELKVRLNQRVNLDQWKIVQSTQEGVIKLLTKFDRIDRTTDIAEDMELKSLPGAKLHNVQWDPDHSCFPGTREKLLHDILDWVHFGSHSILWLTGPAGTGKSSVANSIAGQLDSWKQLGASFHFSRDVATSETPGHLFGNICYQLAFFNDQFRENILSVMHHYGSFDAMPLRNQARKLLVESLKGISMIRPVVIIIDALDESGLDIIYHKNKISRQTLVQAIIKEFPGLPSFIKILITSRKEGSILQLMPTYPSLLHMDITNVDDVHKDISNYIQHRMHEIVQSHHLSVNWPEDGRIKQLAQMADGLFIWADVACSYIMDGPDPKVNLDRLLHQTNSNIAINKMLQVLYMHILQNSINDEPIEINNWHYIVDSIVVLRRPLSIPTIDLLLGLSENSQITTLIDGRKIELTTAASITSLLLPILRVDQASTIHLLHVSVFEFLTKIAKDPFKVDMPVHHSILAMQCLLQMNQNLKYDICNIQNAYSHGHYKHNLSYFIHQHISEALQYACCNFAYHLSDGVLKATLLKDEIHKFLKDSLLYWIETMGLLEKLNEAEISLNMLWDFLKIEFEDQLELLDIIETALALLKNCRRGISFNALHVYESGLPLTPKASVFYQTYKNKFPTSHAHLTHSPWSDSLRVLEGHTDTVSSVIFSPDGTKLATASWDRSVQLWDVATGSAIGSALTGHQDFVTAIAFSLDGNSIASVSRDLTVYLWNIETVSPINYTTRSHRGNISSIVIAPDANQVAYASWQKVHLWNIESGTTHILKGHNKKVTSVIFSPNSTNLATSSWDGTVCIWDTNTGNIIGSPLVEKNGSEVICIAFSPSGVILASALLNGMISLWNIETRLILAVLWGHYNAVSSITFSPDGTKLASVSEEDHTVGMWNIETNKAIGFALLDQSEHIKSVIFSPDGTKLVSMAGDNKIHVWNIDSWPSNCNDLQGHGDNITSVTFSPDGTKIASSSRDHTVCLWDTETVFLNSNNIIREGHSSFITSMVLSPLGSILASAAWDNKIYLWDIETGASVGSALVGHTRGVTSIAFSPDGMKLASASWDKNLLLWNVKTQELIGSTFKGHKDFVTCVVFSPDGLKLASSSWDHTVCLWNVDTQEIIYILKGHGEIVHSVSFSPDGDILASTSQDETIFLWDTMTGISLCSLKGHSKSVTFVVFSPDGSKMASASEDKTICIWNVGLVKSKTALSLILRAHNDSVTSLFFLPGGTKLASASEDNHMYLWDIETGQITQDISQPDMRSIIVNLQGMSFIDNDGFLCCGEQKQLFWLPAHLRGQTIKVSPDAIFIIGGDTGSMTFIKPRLFKW